MGVLRIEMKKGIKMHFEGHIEIGNPKSPYLNSDCVVVEKPAEFAEYVKVRMKRGLIKNNEIMLVPISNCFWINQNKEI